MTKETFYNSMNEILSLDNNDRYYSQMDKTKDVISSVLSRFKDTARSGGILGKLSRLKKIDLVNKKINLFTKSGIKILFTGIPFTINSGVVAVMKNIIKVFDKTDANIMIVNHWWHKYSFFNRDSGGYTKVRISPYSMLDSSGDLVEMKWAFKNILKDMHAKYSFYPDICHVHTHTFYEDSAIQILGKYFPKTRVVYTLHAFIPYIRLSRDDRIRLINDELTNEEIQKIRNHGYRGREHAQEGMIQIADRIVTISQVHKDAFDRIYPEYANKCTCIPNGTDFELYQELEEVVENSRILRSKIAPKNERIIIYVGRLEAQKGSKRLIEGFNLVASHYPDVKLVIIGENDSKLSVLESMGLRREYYERIHFVGWVKDRKILASYYRLADVMVQPVFSKDLYAMATLEAMTLKVPVISCPGTLTVGTCESSDSILAAVKIIFNNPKSIQRHLENVREIVNKNHSLNAVYQSHLKIYHELTNKKI